MNEHERRLEFRIAARVISESCELCEQREFDFLIHDPWERTDTFTCETCAWEG